jgi:hypothetical protein
VSAAASVMADLSTWEKLGNRFYRYVFDRFALTLLYSPLARRMPGASVVGATGTSINSSIGGRAETKPIIGVWQSVHPV